MADNNGREKLDPKEIISISIGELFDLECSTLIRDRIAIVNEVLRYNGKRDD